MAKVLCKLPNASELINGVKFAQSGKLGMLSEDISDEHAAYFLSIKGYVAVKESAATAAPTPAPTTATSPVTPPAAPTAVVTPPATPDATKSA